MSDNTTNKSTDEIPYGYCHCGCGQKTRPARCTRKEAGWIKGEPLRYIDGHYGRSEKMDPPNPSGLCQCGCGQPAPIAVRNNTKLGHLAGEPVRFIVGHSIKNRPLRPAEDRFWAKVNKNGPSGCWDWTGSHDQHGYGQIRISRRSVRAHRFSYELHKGPIPEGLDCLHHCDRPSCVNPDHLYAGDAKQNTADAIARGRAVMPPPNQVEGETNGSAQYTNAQVRAFREEFAQLDISIQKFAELHNVPMVTMWRIIRRKCYKHI